MQAEAAPAQIGDTGKAGEDADGGSRGRPTAGAGNEGAVEDEQDVPEPQRWSNEERGVKPYALRTTI